MNNYKITLDENEFPDKWYNIQPDLPTPLPPSLKPDGSPIGPEDLSPIFPMELIKQEVSQKRWIEIPEEIFEIYKLWRATPLHRAHRLEKALKTPARIYYKNESVSPAGSHKVNSAVAQAYFNKEEGIKNLATETGAGQWGSALSFATNLFDMTCKVFMVKVSYDQKPYRKIMMETWGANIHASPSNLTNAGLKILQDDPNSNGSLGIAISEAVEYAATRDNTKYALGSVLNHVILHQTVIGLETKAQLEKIGEVPDILAGCVGGGSNFAGFAFPFIKDKLDGKLAVDIIASEPTACPTMTKGAYCYDYGDIAEMTPLSKMYTLGHTFIPPSIHAGGLRYHGSSPLLSILLNDGTVKSRAYTQLDAFECATLFAKTEGIIPAPETSHAIKTAIEEAIKCRETGESKCIVFNFSGHGFFDLSSYQKYYSGQLEEYEYPKEKIQESIAKLPSIE
ncbi:MAG: TrpB-like pyridoxal phosphate-dependent enzyme [Methanosarcinales archaeon]|nr:TrpB-like pyridoxal phosphate-dependent enzyme [Methanosarcinales archaeon]